MYGLQPLAFEGDVEVRVLTGLDGRCGVGESVASLYHLVVLVLSWDPGLILVPNRLGLAGIGSSTLLQVSTAHSSVMGCRVMFCRVVR